MFMHKNILTELLGIIIIIIIIITIITHTPRILPNDKISGNCPVSFTREDEVASDV
jgi:hypothetical protein